MRFGKKGAIVKTAEYMFFVFFHCNFVFEGEQ